MKAENISKYPESVEAAQRLAILQKKEEPKPILYRRHFNVHRLYYRKTENSPIEFDKTFLNGHIADLKTKLMNAYYCSAFQAKQGYAWDIKEDAANEEFTAAGESNGNAWNIFVGIDRLTLTRTETNGVKKSVSELTFTTGDPQGNNRISYTSSLISYNKTLERTEVKNDKALKAAHALAEQLADFKPPRVQPKKADLKLVFSRTA